MKDVELKIGKISRTNAGACNEHKNSSNDIARQSREKYALKRVEKCRVLRRRNENIETPAKLQVGDQYDSHRYHHPIRREMSESLREKE